MRGADAAPGASARGEAVVVARRFRGPPESGNGGYVCGLLAARLPGAVRVTLRAPPPLDEALEVREAGPGRLELVAGEAVIAEAEAVAWAPEPPPAPVGREAAEAATRGYAWRTGHPFPGCFVCGPAREPGDALRIFAGPVPGRSVVAAPWTPDPGVCDASATVRPEIVWAALDCPSWFGALAAEPDAGQALLGRMTARVARRPAAGEPCVAMGWSRGREGRKLYAGAALYTAGGELLGSSEAVWIAPAPAER